MSKENLLIVADSDRDADMRYAVGMFVPDPFIYLRLDGRAQVIVSDLEVDRARKQAQRCRVVSLNRCLEQLRRSGIAQPGLHHVIHAVVRARRIRRLLVPHQFPLGLARDLRKLGVKVKVRPGSFFPERETKTPEEVKKLSAALMMAEVGLAEGIQALKQCKIGRRGRLLYRNIPLTAEKLRAIVDTAVCQAGGLPANTIVAGGRQGCDPHERGYGLLRANEPIIIDVFPRSQKTGYHGDITRTVVRGKASESIRKLYHTVERGQELAFAELRHGVSGRRVHEKVQEFFAQQGYTTGKADGRMQGFFHGIGHGLGLELHESPRVSAVSRDTLRAGHVVTVEPGLYYWNLGGGVRLEDVALVTANGARNLTKFEKVLEV
ncbi:MAG TPA: Xaa-Pro peptidase family protein [Methylomirabilota bacterium]|nr:Xaa-Pro peptidase family protein [Methylomirabilota bacterium]